MREPFVSILIDHYNSPEHVGKAIESALEQDYPHKEILLVDDGSPEEAKQALEGYKDRIRIIFQDNQGQCGCLNRCVAESKGDILFFLDGDDWFYPHKVSSMVELYQKIDWKRPVLFFHTLHMVDPQGRVLETRPKVLRTVEKHPVKDEYALLSTPQRAFQHVRKFGFLPFLGPPTSGHSMTRTMAEQVFPLPLEGKVCADSFFFLAAMLVGEIYGTHRTLGAFHWHGENSTHWAPKVIYTDEFIAARDSFLNEKLRERGKPSLVNYKTSIHARTYYRKHLQQPGPTANFAWHIFRRYPSPDTAYLAIKNLLLAFRLWWQQTT